MQTTLPANLTVQMKEVELPENPTPRDQPQQPNLKSTFNFPTPRDVDFDTNAKYDCEGTFTELMEDRIANPTSLATLPYNERIN
jgi:hypothetical protein